MRLGNQDMTTVISTTLIYRLVETTVSRQDYSNHDIQTEFPQHSYSIETRLLYSGRNHLLIQQDYINQGSTHLSIDRLRRVGRGLRRLRSARTRRGDRPTRRRPCPGIWLEPMPSCCRQELPGLRRRPASQVRLLNMITS